MSLGILGGSFNPPHLGHIILAQEIIAEFGLTKLLLVPCYIPPHKTLAADPGAEERLAMTRLLMSYDARIDVLDWEILAHEVSYTVNTLEQLSHAQDYMKFTDVSRPYLIIGDDLAKNFYSWKNPEQILAGAAIIVARRSLKTVSIDFPHIKAHNIIMEISSTMVRNRISNHEGWEWLCPSEVTAYIKQKHFYGAGKHNE